MCPRGSSIRFFIVNEFLILLSHTCTGKKRERVSLYSKRYKIINSPGIDTHYHPVKRMSAIHTEDMILNARLCEDKKSKSINNKMISDAYIPLSRDIDLGVIA